MRIEDLCPICERPHEPAACPRAASAVVWADPAPGGDGRGDDGALADRAAWRFHAPLRAVLDRTREDLRILESLHRDLDQERRLVVDREVLEAGRSLREGRLDEAARSLGSAARKGRGDPKIALLEGFLSLRSGDAPAATDAFEAATLRAEPGGQRAALRLLLGRVQLHRGDRPRAEERFRLALEEAEGPLRSDLHFQLCRMALLAAGEGAAVPAPAPSSAPPVPPSPPDVLSLAEARVEPPAGPLSRRELSGLLRAALDDPELVARLRADPWFAGDAAAQVEAWLARVEGLLARDVADGNAAMDAALAETAPWMLLASADLGARRAELAGRRIPEVPTGLVAVLDAAAGLAGAAAASSSLARAVREGVLGSLRERAAHLGRRLDEAPGSIRRAQAWSAAARDAGRAKARAGELGQADGAAAAAEVEEWLRTLGAHADTLDLMMQEEQDRARTESEERERRLREDRALLGGARARLPRVHVLMLAGLATAVLVGSLAPGSLLLIAAIPLLFAMMDIREVLGGLRARVWTLHRADVDDLAHDFSIRFTVAVLMLTFVGIGLLGVVAVRGEW